MSCGYSGAPWLAGGRASTGPGEAAVEGKDDAGREAEKLQTDGVNLTESQKDV